jgi:hypothetical protein
MVVVKVKLQVVDILVLRGVLQLKVTKLGITSALTHLSLSVVSNAKEEREPWLVQLKKALSVITTWLQRFRPQGLRTADK